MEVGLSLAEFVGSWDARDGGDVGREGGGTRVCVCEHAGLLAALGHALPTLFPGLALSVPCLLALSSLLTAPEAQGPVLASLQAPWGEGGLGCGAGAHPPHARAGAGACLASLACLDVSWAGAWTASPVLGSPGSAEAGGLRADGSGCLFCFVRF